MKKIIFLIFALFVIIPCVSNISVNGEEKPEFTIGDLSYQIITEPQDGKNGTVSVSGRRGGVIILLK